jgi:hypothetical protein
LTAGIVVALVVIAAAVFGTCALFRGKDEVPFQNFVNQLLQANPDGTAEIRIAGGPHPSASFKRAWSPDGSGEVGLLSASPSEVPLTFT